MFRLIHVSDIHFDHLRNYQINNFCDEINKSKANYLIITGDISNGEQLATHLHLLSENIKIPIYFVIGNHDCWNKTIEKAQLIASVAQTDNLKYLTANTFFTLAPKVAIIGHDGWYDLQNGDYTRSSFFPKGMPEFRYVLDFVELSPNLKKQKCEILTEKAAEHLEKNLIEALKDHDLIYLATHVPPYHEASYHMGKIADYHAAPVFSNKIIGERMNEVMRKYPAKKLVILCGHSHSERYYQPISNIEVYTAAAEVGFPTINKIFEI